jgi:Ca-activated chloride channel family protein
MRRLPNTPRAQALRVSLTILQILTATLATTILIMAFALKASAQTPCGTPMRDGLMTPDEAGTGTLLLKTAEPGRYLAAPRVATAIAVDIAGPIARTRLTQRFENPSDGWVEGIYVFPLSENAAVDALHMQIGARFIEGQIKERQDARRIYETAKAEGKKASLIEEERPNLFTNAVANIGPHETIVVQIEYQETLRYDQGRFNLRVPLVAAPRYTPPATASLVRCDDGASTAAPPIPDAPVLRPEWGKVNPVTLTVKLEAGFALGAVESDSFPIEVARNGKTGAAITLTQGEVPADRDFTLSFAPAEKNAPVSALVKESMPDGDYLLALVLPPQTAATTAPKPRETIFVLDNSGSMGGESIKQAKASLLLALSRLSPADRFNVIRFDDTLTVLYPEPVPASAENIAYAKGFVANIEANGGTEMLPALLAALDDKTPTDETHLRQVIFLTDGEVGNEAQLFGAIDEKLGRSRLFTVGIGSAPNAYFMSGAARAGRGTYTYIGNIDDVAPRMAALFAKLEHPVMTGLAAHWPDAVGAEAWPNPLPDLYAGEPVLITLKAPHLDGAVSLHGNLDGKAWESLLDLGKASPATGISKLWARNKIAALEESRVKGADPASIDKAVLQVALDHHLTSRLTSLVAVDVTPSRPANAPLARGTVPLNLPAGWDFDKVFGEHAAPMERRADVSPALLTALAASGPANAAVAPEEKTLVLPQGGTDMRLLLIAGALLILAGLVVYRQAGARRPS